MIKKFLNNLKSFIEISNFERRGVFALLFLFMLFGAYHYWKNTRTEVLPEFDQDKYERFSKNIESALDEQNNSRARKPVTKYSKNKTRDAVLPFDPNNDSFKDLLRKGIPYEVVKNMVRYRESGGRFEVKSDLRKLYSVDDSIYLYLENRVQISDELPSSDSIHTKVQEPVVRPKIDLNIAVEKDLQSIKGVGPSFAKWIIERRKRLGGFTNKEQLMEVYRMDSVLYAKICNQTVLSEGLLTKININMVGYKELYNHPYISYKEAKAIVAYRDQHGPFQDISELSRLYILKGRDLDRLLPYLDVN
ncbi:MAG: helix-hairpin-helix domain-containing protein [Bacteroidia bacterium]